MGCKVKRMSTHCSPPQNKFRFSWPKDAVFMAHEDPVFIAKHPALITQSSGPPSSRKTLTASCASMRGLAAPWRLFSRRSRECHDEQSERGASRSARAHCANTRRQPLTCIGVTCELVPPLLHPLEAVQPLPRREQEPWDWRQREGQVVQVLSAGRTVSAKVRKLGERCCGALLKPLATGRDCLRGPRRRELGSACCARRRAPREVEFRPDVERERANAASEGRLRQRWQREVPALETTTPLAMPLLARHRRR